MFFVGRDRHRTTMRRRESARSTKISWESGNLEGTLTDSAICHEERTIPGPGGNIALGILRSKNSAGGLRPAIYYTYGGVMVFGTRFYEIGTTFEYIKQLDVVVVSVEYRLAPDHFDPAPVEDCFAGLQWVSEHATELGINSKKAVISGLSAGGGLAAGIALTARDRGGPDLLGQCLIYLMLDDRMSTVSSHQYMYEEIYNGNSNINGLGLLSSWAPGNGRCKSLRRTISCYRPLEPPTNMD